MKRYDLSASHDEIFKDLTSNKIDGLSKEARAVIFYVNREIVNDAKQNVKSLQAELSIDNEKVLLKYDISHPFVMDKTIKRCISTVNRIEFKADVIYINESERLKVTFSFPKHHFDINSFPRYIMSYKKILNSFNEFLRLNKYTEYGNTKNFNVESIGGHLHLFDLDKKSLFIVTINVKKTVLRLFVSVFC